MAEPTPLLRPGALPRPVVRLSTDFLRAQEYLEAIIASSSDAIIASDVEDRIVYFSPGAQAMLGVGDAEAVGRPTHVYFAQGRDDARRIASLLRRDGRLRDHEMALRAPDGRIIHISMSASLLRDRCGRLIGSLGISKDITRRVELEARLRALAVTDDLTGLHNQRCFHDRLAREASRARRLRQRLSLVLMDLDGFKEINDRLGHAAGDDMLRLFASAIADNIRRELDSAYRCGGDEFVIILPGSGARRAAEVAERVAAAARGRCEALRCSWGVGTLDGAGGAAELLRSADRRMFAMKSRRKVTLRDSTSAALRWLRQPRPSLPSAHAV
ncbi:MAG: diguanylate cyclase [Elusimicrobia bacterium]|nr:diguanylate cyclase [Elusimicrobiota bacterium]